MRLQIVYRQSNTISLTKVGKYTSTTFGGPFDAEVETQTAWLPWDDGDDLGTGARSEPRVNGETAIVFHDACWSLLIERLPSGPVPLQRLLELTESVTLSTADNYTLSWGHSYGGLFTDGWAQDQGPTFPREDGYRYPRTRSRLREFFMDPFKTPQLLSDGMHQEPSASSSTSYPVSPWEGDPLWAVPEEIWTAIATMMATEDVMNARLASRVFWPAFHTQQFWASRFAPSFERSWLFEARDIEKSTNWRSLYRRTQNRNLDPGLKNRKRIWGLITGLMDLVKLNWHELPGDLSSSWLPSIGPSPARAQVTGDVWDADDDDESAFFADSSRGCRVFRRRCVAVPDTIARLSLSFVAFGDHKFITGISLTTGTGEMVRLGYSSPYECSVAVSDIRGFNLAVGPRGIHALQCITGSSNAISSWLGCPDGAPITRRLAMVGPVAALEAGFDVSAIPSTRVLGTMHTPLTQHLTGLQVG